MSSSEDPEVLEPLNPPYTSPEHSVSDTSLGGRFNVHKISAADEPAVLSQRSSIDDGRRYSVESEEDSRGSVNNRSSELVEVDVQGSAKTDGEFLVMVYSTVCFL